MDIITRFQKNILDNSNNSIKYYFTKSKNKYIIHIENPNNETINVCDNNLEFYTKLINILFDNNSDTKSGCFNYEHTDDDDPLYNSDFDDLMVRFLTSDYCLILIDENFEPLSYLCISGNTLWTLCTNSLFRNKGYMSLLLDHLFKLIQNNKFKDYIDLPNLKIYIKKNNPIKDTLFKYYKKYKFKLENDTLEYLIMKYNI
jgi:hypothetical protein